MSLGFQPPADELLAAGKAQETFTREGTGRAGVLKLRRNQNRVWPGCSRVLGARLGDPGGGRFRVAGRGRGTPEKEEHWLLPPHPRPGHHPRLLAPSVRKGIRPPCQLPGNLETRFSHPPCFQGVMQHVTLEPVVPSLIKKPKKKYWVWFVFCHPRVLFFFFFLPALSRIHGPCQVL